MSSDQHNRFPLIAVTCPKDCDFNKDHAATFSTEMSLIHNVFIRCLNCIYSYAPRIKTGDELAFVGYCLIFLDAIHTHHQEEEDLMFPFFQTKFDMNRNLEQHAAFNAKLTDFEEYIRAVVNHDEKVDFDGEKVRNLVEGFGDDLVEHLHDEIPTISPDRLKEFDEKDLDELMGRHMKHIESLPLSTAGVLVTTHHDLKTAPTWPPFPAPIKWFTRNIAYWKHRRSWMFAPFTRSSAPSNYAY